MRRRLSRTQAVLSRAIPGEWVPMSGMKVRSLISSVIRQERCTSVVFVKWTDGCCAAHQNLRCCALPRDGQVSTDWSRCPGSMAETVWTDTVASLRRNSAGWIPANIGRLPIGVGRKHPVLVRKASFMAGSMRWVWALRHQKGAQYSAVECSRAKVAVGNVVTPASHTGGCRQRCYSSISYRACKTHQECDAWCQLLWSDSRYRRYVSDQSNVTPRYLGSKQKNSVLLLWFTFSLRSASLLLPWKTNGSVVLSFNWRYSLAVAMSLFSTPSTACHSPSALMNARSLAYAYFLEAVVEV